MILTVVVPIKEASDMYVKISHTICRLEDNLQKSTELYKDSIMIMEKLEEAIKIAETEKKDCCFYFPICEIIDSHILRPQGLRMINVRSMQVFSPSA